MDDTRIVRHLDPRAQEFRPRSSSSQTQVALLLPHQMYYSYPSMMPFYNGTVGYLQSLPSSAPYLRPVRANQPPPPPPPPPPTLTPSSPTATRALLLSSVQRNVSETTVRRELEVFGEVRSVQMERLWDGIVTVHFYDLRHAQAALDEIWRQHMQQQQQQQSMLGQQHYTHLQKQHMNLYLGFENFAPKLPQPVPGLIAGRAVWAQFTVPEISAVPDGYNQGTLVVFHLDLKVSSSKLKGIFEAFGPVKELRETPLKRHQRFVEFFDIRDAAKALSEMNGKQIHGKHVIIEFSRPGGHGRSRNDSSPKPLPRLLGRSSSEALPCHPSCVPKKSGCRGDGGGNGKSKHAGTIAAAAQGLLSLNIIGNASEEGERGDHSGTSRNARKSYLGHGSCNLSATMKQSRSGYWKGIDERYDARFLINEDAIVESDIRDTRTTVMIKNIPNKYSQRLLLNMLDNHCIHCNGQITGGNGQPLSSYDFAYLPIDFMNKCNVGYGFVNFTSPQAALRLYKAFHMQSWGVFNSRKICQVTYARLQGLEVLKEHFKNSQFACDIDEYLPVVFSPPRDGTQLSEPVAIGGQLKLGAVISGGVNEKLSAGDNDDDDEDGWK